MKKKYKKKIIFSAKDIASAQSIYNIFSVLRKNYKFDYLFLASEITLPFFLEKKINKIKFIKNDKKKIILKIGKIVKFFKPNYVITGISSDKYSLDEALIYIAKKKRIISLSYQDFCGHVNNSYGTYPDYFLVNDKLSKDITEKVTNKKCFVVGYLNIDFDLMIRKKNFTSNSKQIILILGQPLHHIKGYHNTLKLLNLCLNKYATNYKIIYRLHPMEKKIHKKKIRFFLKDLNFNFSKIKNLNHELIISKYIITCYSSAIINFSYLLSNFYLNRKSSIALLFDTSLKKYYFKISNLNFLPYQKLGITKLVKNKNFLDSTLKNLLNGKFEHKQLYSSKKLFRIKNIHLNILKSFKFLKKKSNKIHG